MKYTYYLVIQINCNLSLVLERFHLFWDSWNKDLNSSRATLVMLEYALLSPSSMSSSPVSTVDHVIGIFNTEVKHWFIFWVGAFIDKFLENTKINYFSDEQICQKSSSFGMRIFILFFIVFFLEISSCELSYTNANGAIFIDLYCTNWSIGDN